MPSRNIRDRVLLTALAAAGFAVRRPTDRTQPTDEIPSPMEWRVRRDTHRYLCGMQLQDTRDCWQIGVNETEARLVPIHRLQWWLGAQTTNGLAPVTAHPIWICGPDAAWIATGTSDQLVPLQESLAAANAEYRAKVLAGRIA